ncbi:hypothetical protein E2562_017384 [Oryza meyeriana var. granulata]|uniref:Uncharacterized protein n=1 Tax=Oryza meyeriana var. granulata TaxID=110450 RepID=A0A6G1D528_9ORYZ|nr:hypothetical protein E2562_017384 [Oryza meyeriana var. granulata]
MEAVAAMAALECILPRQQDYLRHYPDSWRCSWEAYDPYVAYQHPSAGHDNSFLEAISCPTDVWKYKGKSVS